MQYTFFFATFPLLLSHFKCLPKTVIVGTWTRLTADDISPRIYDFSPKRVFQVLSNGNLVLPPFRAEDYKQEVHAQTYRCVAENAIGKIVSRDVHVRAGRTNRPSLRGEM